MATKRLPRDLLAKAARDQEYFLELSGQVRPLWKDALRISQSLEEIGR